MATDVIVMGKGKLAIQVAGWFLERGVLKGVVPVVPEPEWADSFNDWAREQLVTRWLGFFPDLPQVDQVWSVYYDKILPPEFITNHGRVLNIHNGPLPRYRGMNPVNWALKNGELQHGVTIHEIDEGVDTGPIVAQVTFPIYPRDEVADLYYRCLRYGWELFQDTVLRLHELPAWPQQGIPLTYTKEHASMLEERAGWHR